MRRCPDQDIGGGRGNSSWALVNVADLNLRCHEIIYIHHGPCRPHRSPHDLEAIKCGYLTRRRRAVLIPFRFKCSCSDLSRERMAWHGNDEAGLPPACQWQWQCPPPSLPSLSRSSFLLFPSSVGCRGFARGGGGGGGDGNHC